MIKIAWGCPTIRDIDPKVYKNHLSIALYCYEKEVCRITGLAMPNDMHVVKARNKIVEVVKELDVDYLFFIAQDIIAPIPALEMLLSLDKDVVSGFYFMKGMPNTPVAFKDKGDSKETGYYKRIYTYGEGTGEVEFSGLDCILIRKAVLTSIDYPYFALDNPNGTEDSFFCRKVIEAGWKIHVDTRVKVGHLGQRMVYDHDTYQKHKRKVVAEVYDA